MFVNAYQSEQIFGPSFLMRWFLNGGYTLYTHHKCARIYKNAPPSFNRLCEASGGYFVIVIGADRDVVKVVDVGDEGLVLVDVGIKS